MNQRIIQLILLFWSVWFSIIVSTNFFDYLKSVNYLSKEWKFASGNFKAMLETTDIYNTPRTFVIILYFGVILWQITCSFFFWRAFVQTFSKNIMTPTLYLAFSLGLALFASFAITTEIFIDYSTEETFLRIFIALLLSLSTCHLLSNERAK